MARIKDIAEKSGFSISTVSRVLNFDPDLSVSDETREKIWRAAESLNYRKRFNQIKEEARPLRVGLVCLYPRNEELEELFYLSISSGVESRCQREGISVFKFFYGHFHEIKASGVQWIIAVGKFHKNHADRLAAITENIIFVDSNPDEGKYDVVLVDFEYATKSVINYLKEKGHTTIGYIGGRELIPGESDRHVDLRGKIFREYMQELRMYNEAFIYTGNFTTEDGYQLMKSAIREHGEQLPTAFFAGNDQMAVGCLRALAEENIPVPERVNIIGLNDISIAKYVYPPLSTVRVHKEEMGKAAVNLMIERINGRKVAKKVFIGTELIVRESSF